MKTSPVLRLLYHTAGGRMILKLLVRPGVSRAVGRFLDSPLSKPLIVPFARGNGISLDGIRVPENGFTSFNAFFCRERTDAAMDMEPGRLCSPCDGYLSAFAIDSDSSFAIKHSRYSLPELLKDAALAETFAGGTALIFRLTPANYHRYCFVDDGTITKTQAIPGVLHCVRPIATEAFPVYVQNSREYVQMESAQFGTMIQMEIGALLVGRICNHSVHGHVLRGQEKGYFAFGGSTIVLLLTAGVVELRRSAEEEIPVKQGEWIGTVMS